MFEVFNTKYMYYKRFLPQMVAYKLAVRAAQGGR